MRTEGGKRKRTAYRPIQKSRNAASPSIRKVFASRGGINEKQEKGKPDTPVQARNRKKAITVDVGAGEMVQRQKKKSERHQNGTVIRLPHEAAKLPYETGAQCQSERGGQGRRAFDRGGWGGVNKFCQVHPGWTKEGVYRCIEASTPYVGIELDVWNGQHSEETKSEEKV